MKVLITGGAGFIGSNAAQRFLAKGDEVVVIDNLSRAGADSNLVWLRSQGKLEFVHLDIRDAPGVYEVIAEHRDVDLILHLAAQVAVTTSVMDPRTDFEVNALGTVNILEAARIAKIDAPIIYSSTNKVYGRIDDVRIVERKERYEYADCPLGISEQQNLDFHSPYGCSKGAAEQYVRDYYRIYGLNTVVMRQSCIYGPRQFGMEDQGWVAWFMIAADRGYPLTVYGDGKQVRDILFVEDLLDVFEAAAANINASEGGVFNIGGGPANAIALLDLVTYIRNRRVEGLKHAFGPWRPGDQRIYVSDIRHARAVLGWEPRVNVKDGLDRLYKWISENRELLRCAA